MYTIDTCPHLMCKDCLYWGKQCKRIGGTNLEFARPYFVSQPTGRHTPCNSFEPKHPEYADLKEWTNFEDFWKVYKEVWLPYGNENIECAFVINGDKSIRYYVPFEKFMNGTMIEDGKLMAIHKRYYKQTREGFGYKLVTEEINGIEL